MDGYCLLIPSSPQVPPITVAPDVLPGPDTEGRPAFLLLRRQELPKRRKQCVNVSLIFPPVYNLNPVACALDINSACRAGRDCDLLTPRVHTNLRPGLDLPGFRVRSGDAKPALRDCFHAGLKNFIRACGKVHAALIGSAHFSSIHANSGPTARSTGKMLSRSCLSRRGQVTRNTGSSRPWPGLARSEGHNPGAPGQCGVPLLHRGAAALR
jgi:hypothetical protein